MMLMMMMMVMVMTIYCIKSVAISLQSRDYIDWVRWRLSRLFDDYFHSFLSQATRFSFVKSNSHYDFRKSILIIQEYFAGLHLIASYHQRKRSITNPFQYKIHTELDSPQCRLKAYLILSDNTIPIRHSVDMVLKSFSDLSYKKFWKLRKRACVLLSCHVRVSEWTYTL